MSNDLYIRDFVEILGSITADSNRHACVIKGVLKLIVRLLIFSLVTNYLDRIWNPRIWSSKPYKQLNMASCL